MPITIKSNLTIHNMRHNHNKHNLEILYLVKNNFCPKSFIAE